MYFIDLKNNQNIWYIQNHHISFGPIHVPLNLRLWLSVLARMIKKSRLMMNLISLYFSD